MRDIIAVACIVILWVLLLDSSRAEADLLEDFVVAGGDPDDFNPSGEFDGSGSFVFVPGSTLEEVGFELDAALAAIHTRSGREVWRVVVGRSGRTESYQAVVARRGRVCAVGTRAPELPPEPDAGPRELLLACYAVANGSLVWAREFDLSSFRDAFVATQLEIIGDTLVLRLETVSLGFVRRRIMLFRLRDGA